MWNYGGKKFALNKKKKKQVEYSYNDPNKELKGRVYSSGMDNVKPFI